MGEGIWSTGLVKASFFLSVLGNQGGIMQIIQGNLQKKLNKFHNHHVLSSCLTFFEWWNILHVPTTLFDFMIVCLFWVLFNFWCNQIFSRNMLYSKFSWCYKIRVFQKISFRGKRKFLNSGDIWGGKWDFIDQVGGNRPL